MAVLQCILLQDQLQNRLERDRERSWGFIFNKGSVDLSNKALLWMLLLIFSIWVMMRFNCTSSRPNGASLHSWFQWSCCCWLGWLGWHRCVSITSSEEQRSPDVIDLLSTVCGITPSYAQICGSDSFWSCCLWTRWCFLYGNNQNALGRLAELRLGNFYNHFPFTFQPNCKCLMQQNPIYLVIILFLVI